MLTVEDMSALIENNRYPCYIRGKNADKITYANPEFFKVFECDESIYDQKIVDFIKIDGNSIQSVTDNSLHAKKWEFIFYHEQTSRNYSGSSKLLSDNKTVFCEYEIFHNAEFDKKFESAMTKCMDIYQQTEDVLPSLMELLSDYYNAERSYVYSYNQEKSIFNNVANFTKDSHKVTQEITKELNSNFILNWIKEYNQSGIAMINKNSPDFDHSSMFAKVLTDFNIQNMTVCAVFDTKNEVIGIVGVSNRDNFDEFFDRRLINTIARFIAQNVANAVVNDTLLHDEHLDALTGFYNRVGCSRRLTSIQRNPPKSVGVISANINGLKFINETYGTEGGDDFIQFTAQQLKGFFKFEFFRMGGDEFLGLALDIDKSMFENKIDVFHKTMKQQGNQDVSIGHAFGERNFNIGKLIQESENIMYINKQEFYRTSDRAVSIVNDTDLSQLLEYIEKDMFVIYLQSQVNLHDGSLYGAEALIRLYDKENDKLIYPDQFIPIYEKKSIIRHIDIYVIETVCKLLQKWKTTDNLIPISVNLSRVTLQEFGIIDTITTICDKYEVPHEFLVIEVTERVGLVENNVASSLIQSFKDKGFNISLDDFGCAYSNIVTLAQIEVDEVKLDKSLVDDLAKSKKNMTLVKNVLSMCNELDKTSTLAEGIEDAEQAKLLHQLGCHLGQGYYYSRPISVEDFEVKYFK